MRRRFIVAAGTVEDLQRTVPLLARCVSAALMISHGLRVGTDLLLHSLSDGFTVHFTPDRLKGVRPDEASLTGILTKALRAASAASDRPRSVHTGVLVCKRALSEHLTHFGAKYVCSSRGLDLRCAHLSCQSIVLIVPLRGELHVEGAGYLKCYTDVLWPDQVISLLNLYLDRCCR